MGGRKPKAPAPLFHVYVVELATDELNSVGPMGAVYVGETALAPEARYSKHKAGGKTAARIVARHGVRLRPDLAPPEGPFATRQEGLRFEKKTANRLRHRGYSVFGGQGGRFMRHQVLPGSVADLGTPMPDSPSGPVKRQRSRRRLPRR